MAGATWSGRDRLLPMFSQPIKSINVSSRRRLANLLDPTRSTTSSTGLVQDWQGLAELMELDYNDIEMMKEGRDKTYSLIQQLSEKRNTNIGTLYEYLEQLERYDILEDEVLQEKIVRDVEAFTRRQAELQSNTNNPVQVAEVNSSETHFIPREIMYKNITVGEVMTGKKEYFEGYVCYTRENSEFVETLIQVLEQQHGMKLCLVERDVTPAFARNSAISYLISQRCKKIIVVLSQSFLNCPECDFITKFAQALDPGARQKKLIPILTEPCTPPDILKFITMVDCTRVELRKWLWVRIACSLKEVSFMDTSTEYGREQVRLQNLQQGQQEHFEPQHQPHPNPMEHAPTPPTHHAHVDDSMNHDDSESSSSNISTISLHGPNSQSHMRSTHILSEMGQGITHDGAYTAPLAQSHQPHQPHGPFAPAPLVHDGPSSSSNLPSTASSTAPLIYDSTVVESKEVKKKAKKSLAGFFKKSS